MDVQAGEVVHRLEALQRPKLQQVERPAEVDEERVVPRAGEDLHAVIEGVDGLLRHRTVAFGVGRRADVVGRYLQALGDGRPPPLGIVLGLFPFEDRHGIELFAVQVRVVQGGDRAGVKREEGVGVGVALVEAELEAEVGLGVPVVVDVDLVEDVLAEPEEGRARRRLLERYVVGDQRHRLRVIRADERVHVGGVRLRIRADKRRLPVRGRTRRHRRAEDADRYGRGDHARDRDEHQLPGACSWY